MPGGSGQLDAAVPPGPRDGPLHPSPQEPGQIQDLEIPRNSTTPMSSFTKIDDTSSDAKTLRTELSMSYLSSDVLDRSSDGYAVVGKDDKLSIKDDHRHPTVVRSEIGQVGGLDAIDDRRRRIRRYCIWCMSLLSLFDTHLLIAPYT